MHMYKSKVILLIISIISAIIIIFSNVYHGFALENDIYKRVLFISSYSYSWPTVPLQIEGIQSVLKDTVTLDIEYMDTKSVNDDISNRIFYERIKYRLSKVTPYDAIIVGDDAAFEFAKKYQDELFYHIPIVFEGVNNVGTGINANNNEWITGVVEQLSYKSNMDVALKINPNAKKIVALLDNTITGEGERQQFYAQKENYSQLEFSEINTSELTQDEIKNKIANLNKDTIFLYLVFSEDIDGNLYTNSQVVKMINNYANIPTYRFIEAGIGEGVLGGNIVSHKKMGQIAAQIVLETLNGKEIKNMKVLTQNPNCYYFDYNVIEKFNIDMDFIPKDSNIINRKPSFWEAYGKVVSITIGISAIITAIILILYKIAFEKNKNRILTEKNIQLADAITRADSANKSKSQFLSQMSHEIRTPMNAIVGITAIAKKYAGDKEKTAEYLDKINVSSKVLLNIINDVLDMSAIESKKLRIAEVPFDFKALLSSISTMYYIQCKQKGIKFNMLLSNVREEFLIGDSLRLNQILLNLISNAYKFTEAGGEIKVIIEETDVKDERVFIKFKVLDTGCGISEEMQSRIFKPFEQESTQIAKNYGGSGLGLSITKNLVEMMQGAITFESQKGKGTIFTVDLPFKIDDYKVKNEDVQFKDIKALVVDDDDDARNYTAIVLDRIGVNYELVKSGEEAMETLQHANEIGNCYDICFIDWQMPDLNGIEVTKKIRQLYDKNTIIIIVSAYDLSEVEDEARAAGANMFISKPLFQSTVYNLFMNLSGGKYTKYTAKEKIYDFKGKCLLLAEDNALNSEIAVELLSTVGFSIDCAKNGEEVVNMFVNSAENKYDAILMDVQMPIMDGYEATKKIRSSVHVQAVTIPIFAMTANAFVEDISAAYLAGMNGHIAKPIDTEILYSTLDKYFKGEH